MARDLGEVQAAEKFQIHQLGQRRLGGGQRVERFAERHQIVVGALYSVRLVGVERRQVELAAALDGAAFAHVVDDQAAHRPRRVGEEARPVGKDNAASAEVDVGLVQQRRRAQGQARRVDVQLPARQPVQLAVQRREHAGAAAASPHSAAASVVFSASRSSCEASSAIR